MKRFERGDTLIELVIAFAIFSLAAIMTLSILNRGVSATQRSLEATLVRQQIDSQAELLRYIHATNPALWGSMIASPTTTPDPISTNTACPVSPSNAFYINPTVNVAEPDKTVIAKTPISAATYRKPQTYAKVNYGAASQQAEGIWIQVAEAENDSNPTVRAYDFYIHACWDSVGLDVPLTLGTIVRLYAR
ncbi:MAG: type II secretion system protein [Candidatus Saccharimonas sp.]